MTRVGIVDGILVEDTRMTCARLRRAFDGKNNMEYREELTWVVRFEASAEFAEDYDGELDGYVWREQFYRDIQPRVLAAIYRELADVAQAKGGVRWRIRPGNRGMSSRDEVLIHVELEAADGNA